MSDTELSDLVLTGLDTQILTQAPVIPYTAPIVTPDQLGGKDNCLEFCVCPGIGDILFNHTKTHCLKEVSGKEVIFYLPGFEGNLRGADIMPMLPNVHFGGCLHDRTSASVVSSSLHSTWGSDGNYPSNHAIYNLAANWHLEAGNTIADWLPQLPANYHIDLNIPQDNINQANHLFSDMPDKIVTIYMHNREKDLNYGEQWKMWSDAEWIDFIVRLERLPNFKGCGFFFIGVCWDSDKTSAVYNSIKSLGYPCKLLIGYPLPTITQCIKKSYYMVSYASGMPILADVVNTPTLMWLPSHLKGLENTFADPANIASGKFKAKINLTHNEALQWVENNEYLSRGNND